MWNRFRVVGAGLGSGLLLAILDGLAYGPAWGAAALEHLKPILRSSVDPAMGTAVDLAYGLGLAVIYRKISPSLPGANGLARGACFGLGLFFVRVAMDVAGRWMMTTTPPSALAFLALVGFIEMLAVGMVLGSLLPPK